MLADHVAKGRDCTVACIEVPREEAKAFGVMAVDDQWHITDFVEKPADPPCMPGSPDRSLASMGIYIFNASYLYAELERDMADPHVEPRLRQGHHPARGAHGCAAAHPFDIELRRQPRRRGRRTGATSARSMPTGTPTSTSPPPTRMLNLYDTHWPIWTYQPQLQPAKFVHNQIDRRGMAVESLVSGGSIVSGEVLRSVLFSGVRVHSYSHVEWSVLLPEVQVGRRVQPQARRRRPRLPHPRRHGDRRGRAGRCRRFFRTDTGITLVTSEMLARLAR